MAIMLQGILNIETTVARRRPSWRINLKDLLYTDSTILSYSALFRPGLSRFLFFTYSTGNFTNTAKKINCDTHLTQFKIQHSDHPMLGKPMLSLCCFWALCTVLYSVVCPDSMHNAHGRNIIFLLKAGSSTRFLKIVKIKLKKRYILVCISSRINIKDVQTSVKASSHQREHTSSCLKTWDIL